MKPLILPEYIFCYRSGSLGAGMILLTTYPYIMGRIILYKSHDDMLRDCKTKKVDMYSIVPGYTIAIQFAGIFPNNRLVVDIGMLANIQIILHQMAQLFLDERVFNKPGYYKKYKDEVTH